MLTSMKNILEDSHKHYYGVMAMNCVNIEMARAAIMAASEENSPIIIQIGPKQMKLHGHKEEMYPLVKDLAERVHVPVALNLDHGTDYDVIADCINTGFTNVMFDGSSLPFEENLQKTEIICQLAHMAGCSVEAELGHVGMAVDDDDENFDLFTNPEQAKDFVERTGVDCLAVAIGTAHGDYPKGRVPKLDFERLALLKKTLDMPLVLHGGSGTGEENIKKAVSLGINKINVATDVCTVAKKAMLDEVEKNPKIDYVSMCIAAEKSMKEYVKYYINLIGSNNRFNFGDVEYHGHE
ncbi:class II fructose-bisphosphate aldolase [Enterococcus hulanensis]|uniref:class II fructose-bisphosphate aldolase n=1 Tax=Enterococcus hulanensis TaxID=2559929 RepID=UPI001A901CCD|nr:class II fructose-bisphosphate aldolase [Enterococcus hulanensis]MBO0456008.1 class II fructose-bisphosphate aldolase [Enterococcus hulanensis]